MKVDCESKPNRGHCGKKSFGKYIPHRRFYFDKITYTCKTFFYSGCGENDNSYSTEKDCLDTCLPGKLL